MTVEPTESSRVLTSVMPPQAAGYVALMKVPGGEMISMGSNEP